MKVASIRGRLELQHNANIIKGVTMCNFPPVGENKNNKNQQKMVKVFKPTLFSYIFLSFVVF